MSKTNQTDLLRTHLNVKWLRPESALWDAIASILISKYEIVPPSLDLGCGNGIFSFITAGGDFSIDYDWYINVADTREFWENRDIYDTYTLSSAKYITVKPGYSFTYGLDHKLNLLNQAKNLSFYENTLEYNANLALPFDDRKFKTVFSNILYWLNDPTYTLGEIYRILDTGGSALLCIPNSNFFDYCVTYRWKETNSELLRLLNRGRSESMHRTFSYKEFVGMSRNVGFEVSDHGYYLSPLTLNIWDIGLRSLSPHLIKMTNCLTPDERRNIKKEWMETLMMLIDPLFQMEMANKIEGGFHLFVLNKSH